MENFLFSPIPLGDLEASIAKIVEEKLRSILDSQTKAQGDIVYITREEVAGLLHVSLPTLRQLTRTGVLSSYKIGTRVLYDLAEVNKSVKTVKSAKYRRGPYSK